jgi:hypothetical protein
MNVAERIVKKVWNEITTPKTYRMGEEFQDYVRNKLFPKDKYTILHRTHDFVTNKDDFVESTSEPDFKFKSISSGRMFFVEAKYRSDYYHGVIEWRKQYQLNRYQEINQRTPVFVVLGVGGKPDAPNQVFLMPVRDIKYSKLFRSFLKSFEILRDVCIEENRLQV